MLVRDVMTANVISISAQATILEAARTMLRNRISGLPVVDAEGRLIGMVTEGDFLRRSEIGTERRRPKWLEFVLGPGRMAEEYVHVAGRKVEDVMTRDPVAVGEDDDLHTMVELMEQRRVKRLPVLRNGKIVGVVSRANLMRALVSLARSEEAPAGGDTALREHIVAAFAQQPWAPHVNIVVKDSIAELWGTITDERERQACVVTAENVAGVRAVHDHLTWVEPISGMAFPSPEDEAERQSKYESKREGKSETKAHADTTQNAIH